MRTLPSRKLDKRITRVWRLSALANVVVWATVGTAPIGVLALILGASSSPEEQTAATVLMAITFGLLGLTGLALIVFVVVIPKIRWIQWRFDVLDEEIDIHRGIFWRKRLIIPLIRVQNVETRQGPILRANRLASLTVATAAGEHTIPGLGIEEADALRDQVAVLARIAQEDV
ncbi:MAG: PH domain-containing protein [Propionibacteriaceae bacterium]|jgi:membrane protein YdbS with pleckstrin-like domain|nr:PH domain-containing protein [Propionibacteriaceae bacterium]